MEPRIAGAATDPACGAGGDGSLPGCESIALSLADGAPGEIREGPPLHQPK